MTCDKSHTLPNPRHVKRVNWYSYHSELCRTVLYDPTFPIAIKADTDYFTTHLQTLITTAVDKHTYLD